MDWQDIAVSLTRKNFTYKGNAIFKKDFIEVLEFQFPGIAAVKNNNGWFHIKMDGIPIYSKFYERAFGFYYNRAAVNENGLAYHIGIDGLAAYKEKYLWCGNFQENISVVKNLNFKYFHIDLNGNPLYKEKYFYAGDFKEGIACVCSDDGYYTHIKSDGKFLHDKKFRLLDVYHKGYARAKDDDGWFHIDRHGVEIYYPRYSLIEPFYNGFAFCLTLKNEQIILSEKGEEIRLNLRNAK
jgi:hypothetical protein